MKIDLWLCPNSDTPRCIGSYYGSSSSHGVDLAAIPRLGRVEDRDRQGERLVKGTRADCPNCGTPRIKISTQVTIPEAYSDEPVTAA